MEGEHDGLGLAHDVCNKRKQSPLKTYAKNGTHAPANPLDGYELLNSTHCSSTFSRVLIHVYTSRFSAGVPAPLVAQSAGLLPVSSFVTPGELPKSLWPGVCEYSRGETHRAGRCGRIKDRKSARCHCLLLTMTTTKTSHRPASAASSPPLLAFFEALFCTVMTFIKERWPTLRFQARQRRKGGGEGALPHRRF